VQRMTENSMPEFIDPVFVKTSPKRSFCMTENQRFGLVFVKTELEFLKSLWGLGTEEE
jgi:hypothetical protein